ncbi:hypothetical protein BDV30DRAFT_235187 [Aspergillus minisclerotigenes]|uniref:Tat pathway signal sequence n=1 Tax=Aspergillus minisclerotigenes TaxID=656917 RepID=A0A5N6JGA6_9EURO|nr:hypothetical protein BDV30DRAFT_235187 [Aspergillus minisclerotigenes]
MDSEEIPFLLPEQPADAKETKAPRTIFQGLMYKSASVLMLVVSGVLTMAGLQYPNDAQCISKMSTWSPMLEAVEYEWRHFHEEAPNKYYGKPNDELEQAWGKLWQYGSTGVPDSKLHLLNKSRAIDWKYLPNELGGGIEAFFEGFHQIHCLDLVRQYTYRDEYDYSLNPAFLRQPSVFYNHVDHCIETLRINIMCTADVTPRFDKLVQWAEERIVHPYNVTAERIRAIQEVKFQSTDGGQSVHSEHEHAI